MNLIKTIKALRTWHKNYARIHGDFSKRIPALDAALAHLRSREQTIRECAEICDAYAFTADAKAAILKLMEKKP